WLVFFFFFSSRRRHTRFSRDWSSTCALPICVGRLRVRNLFGHRLGDSERVLGGRKLLELVDLRTQLGQVASVVLRCVGRRVHGRSEERRVGKERGCGWCTDR